MPTEPSTQPAVSLPAENGPVAIRVCQLNHTFGEGESGKQVLFDNNLEIGAGELVLLTGPSGSGKTTLLTLIGALRSVREGSVCVLGRELHELPNQQLVTVRRAMGFIFQQHNLFDSLTALENVKLGAQLECLDKNELTRSAIEMLEKVGLGHRLHYRPKAMSVGQQQRVAIARALVRRPKLILADEPTAALDKDSTRQVVNLLKTMTIEQQATVIIVTHDNRILDIADRIVNMVDGRIVSNVLVDLSAKICEMLKRIGTFDKLGPDELFDIAEKMLLERQPAETTIVRQGEEGDNFYVIAKGEVEVRLADDAGTKVLATLAGGDFFGEMALISEEPRMASVVSTTPVELYSLSKNDFRAIMETSTPFRDQLLKVVFRRQA